jgi:hypothetical protein
MMVVFRAHGVLSRERAGIAILTLLRGWIAICTESTVIHSEV